MLVDQGRILSLLVPGRTKQVHIYSFEIAAGLADCGVTLRLIGERRRVSMAVAAIVLYSTITTNKNGRRRRKVSLCPEVSLIRVR